MQRRRAKECVCPLDGPAGQRETSLESGFEGRNQCDGWMAGNLKGSWGDEARFQQTRGFPQPGEEPYGLISAGESPASSCSYASCTQELVCVLGTYLEGEVQGLAGG